VAAERGEKLFSVKPFGRKTEEFFSPDAAKKHAVTSRQTQEVASFGKIREYLASPNTPPERNCSSTRIVA